MSNQHKRIASNNGKIGVPRHTRFSKSSAHRCEKQAESRVRQAAWREIRSFPVQQPNGETIWMNLHRG